MSCRSCFADLPVKSALINIAQPRWVGPNYWACKPRIVIVMLNPGSGDARGDKSPDNKSLALLQALAAGEGSLASIFEHQANDMPNWGGGKFVSFYLHGLNLSLKTVAFVNVAWCATSGNSYPAPMLQRCFNLHTGELLRALAPNLILLSGSSTHGFTHSLRSIVPEATIVRTFHYANRGSANAKAAELARVRKIIVEASAAVA